MNLKKFFITTPIYYINDVPHIGHSCTTIAADIIARLHRQLGEKVFFLTGTDEHGQKVDEAAKKLKLKTQDYCDQISPRFKEAWKSLNISFDYFIRTTDKKHKKVVKEVMEKIYKKGDVYKAKYEGWYCVGCEKFLTESDLVDGKCPLHPKDKTVWKSEENWFFKLSKYVPQLIKLIEDPKSNYIFPEGKRSEILAKIKSEVKDISLSRENVDWGVEVPWDKKQSVYVWFDALINYYSASQFVEGKKEFWPADLHLLGKEILWFHTVIWQAMLLSAEIELPKKTYTHSFYMIDGQKMSKSLGNVISPEQLVENFGVDGSRYLVARSFPSNNDSDIGVERFKEKYNADLANNLGNLVSRVCKLAEGNDYGKNGKIELDKEFVDLINNCKFNEAINYIFVSYIDSSNELLNNDKPWTLDRDDPKRNECLKICRNNLQKVSYHLRSVMPESCKKIEKLLEGKIEAVTSPLFLRI